MAVFDAQVWLFWMRVDKRMTKAPTKFTCLISPADFSEKLQIRAAREDPGESEKFSNVLKSPRRAVISEFDAWFRTSLS